MIIGFYGSSNSIKQPLKEVALLLLKLGTILFGGPATHIAMMENEVVQKYKLVDEQHFFRFHRSNKSHYSTNCKYRSCHAIPHCA